MRRKEKRRNFDFTSIHVTSIPSFNKEFTTAELHILYYIYNVNISHIGADIKKLNSAYCTEEYPGLKEAIPLLYSK